MKALTLTQPWATLVAIGAKRIETRSWSTSYRGELAIHAAQGFPKCAQEFADEQIVQYLLNCIPTWGPNWPKLPLGCVIATCRLVELMPTECLANRVVTPKIVTEQELAFGNYSPGRWGWILEDVHMLPEPIRAKGARRLWEWNPEAARVAGEHGAESRITSHPDLRTTPLHDGPTAKKATAKGDSEA